MTRDRHQLAKQLFLECCDLSPEPCAAFLTQRCGQDLPLREEVEAMLAFDRQQPEFLRRPPELPKLPPARLPEQIGGFRVLGVLGEGGMGTVYEAEQEHPRRRVALKVMRPGLASASMLHRFAGEVAALGRLAHPGIAQIFEAGTFDDGHGSQPYFAMERVRGVNLSEHARRLELGTRERLELVARVCAAVHHAHTQGIVHRDLKPANVLVDEHGQPKVLDFGVARSLDIDAQTATFATDVGQMVGTLPYMSPEQVAADAAAIDARSDVYSLGVLTYELLAGRLPHDLRGKLIHEAARIIQEREPAALSSVNPVLRGDLETIVAKCLEKERSRRYQSARALADDIERYLRNEPIQARPATRLYQLRKFARRNRVLVIGALLVFFALLLGLAGTGWQAVRALDRQRQAEHEASRVRAVLDFFLSGMLTSVNPWEQGRDVRMVSVLDLAAEQAGAAFEGDPELEAEIRSSLGQIYRNLGFHQKARPHLERSYERWHELRGPDHATTLAAGSLLGDLFRDLGLRDQSLALLEPVLARCRAKLGASHSTTLACLSRTAGLYLELERFDDAERLNREALEQRVRLFGEAAPQTLDSKYGLAQAYLSQQRFDDSERLMQEVHQGRLAQLGPRHPRTVQALQARARSLMPLGKYEAAEELYRKALATLREVLGDEHPDTIDAINDLAGAVHEAHGPGQAEPLNREALELGRKVLGPDHPGLAEFLNNLASALEELGRLDEAGAMYDESLEIRERCYGPNSLHVAKALNNLGTFHHRRGLTGDAEEFYRRAIALYLDLFGEHNVDLATTQLNLGTLLMQSGRLEQAGESYAAGLEAVEMSLPDDHPLLPVLQSHYAWCLVQQERYEEAEPLLLSSLEGYRRRPKQSADDVKLVLERLLSLYRAWQRPEDARLCQEQLDGLQAGEQP